MPPSSYRLRSASPAVLLLLLSLSACRDHDAASGSAGEKPRTARPEKSAPTSHPSPAEDAGAPDRPAKIDCARAIADLSGLSPEDLAMDGPNGRTLESLITWYTPDQFEAVWSILEKIGPPTYRINPWKQLFIKRMVENGDHDSLSRVVAAANKSYGPGSKLDSMIGDVFGSAKLTEGSFQAIRGMDDASQRKTALAAVSRGLRYLPDLSVLDPAWLQGLAPDEALLLVAGMTGHGAPENSGLRETSINLADGLAFVEKLTAQGTIPPEAPSVLIAQASGARPFECWELIQPGLSGYSADTLGEVALNMAKADPDKAMKLLTGAAAGELPSSAITQAMGRFLGDDSRAAGNWYEEHRSSLPSGQQDAVKLALASHAMATGDPAAAAKWVNAIDSPQTRSDAAGLLEKK